MIEKSVSRITYWQISEATNSDGEGQIFLSNAHWIGITDILPWDRKSYPTLPRLSREGYIWVVLELTHMIVKSPHCYVKMTSSCEIAS